MRKPESKQKRTEKGEFSVKGFVTGINPDIPTFQIESMENKKELFVFEVIPDTEFLRLSDMKERSDQIGLKNLQLKELVTVSFTKNKDANTNVAERVVIENSK